MRKLTDEENKYCPDCKCVKPKYEFSKHAKRKDGLQSSCKKCMSSRYFADHERIRKKQNENWAEYSERKREALIEKSKTYRLATKEKAKGYRNAYVEKYPIKIQAKTTLHSHVLTGRVAKQPCEICGDIKADAHHDDYAKPLDVRWLCRKHHAQWHAENGAGKNG